MHANVMDQLASGARNIVVTTERGVGTVNILTNLLQSAGHSVAELPASIVTLSDLVTDDHRASTRITSAEILIITEMQSASDNVFHALLKLIRERTILGTSTHTLETVIVVLHDPSVNMLEMFLDDGNAVLANVV